MPTSESDRLVYRLRNRAGSRPLEVLAEGELALSTATEPKLRALVLALMHRIARAAVAHLEAEGDGAALGDRPRPHFVALEQRLTAALAELEAHGVRSAYVERLTNLQEQLFAAPDMDEWLDAYSARLELERERELGKRARAGEVLQTLEACTRLEGEPTDDLLEVVTAVTVQALNHEIYRRRDGWQERAGALSDAFARLVQTHWLPWHLGELAVANVVSLATLTRAPEHVAEVKALTPILVQQPALAFRLARLYAGLKDKPRMLRYLRRACVLDRSLFQVDDSEFKPYLGDSDFEALMKEFPSRTGT